MTDIPKITLTKSGHVLTATDEQGHSVAIPHTLDGLRLLATLLDAKAAIPNATIGTIARPTQAMIDAFLKRRDLERQTLKLQEIQTLKETF